MLRFNLKFLSFYHLIVQNIENNSRLQKEVANVIFFLPKFLRKYCIRRTWMGPRPRAAILPQPLVFLLSLTVSRGYLVTCPPLLPFGFKPSNELVKPCKTHSSDRTEQSKCCWNCMKNVMKLCESFLVICLSTSYDRNCVVTNMGECWFRHSSNYTFPFLKEFVKLLRTLAKYKMVIQWNIIFCIK